jgi:hypothetical protein
MLNLNGSKLYKPHIPEPPLKFLFNLSKKQPKEKEIRAIIGDDGETYLNAKDICINIQAYSYKYPFTSNSVIQFAKSFVLNLIR